MASKVTRDEASILDGVTLGSLLPPLYFTIDHYHMNVDIVIMGEEMRPFSEFSEQVFNYLILKLQLDFSLLFSLIVI